MGFFAKFRQGLTKTASILQTDVRDLFKSEGRLIDDIFLDEMRAILFKTDMGFDAVEQIVQEVATNFRGRVVTLEEVVETWKTKLSELMMQEAAPIQFAESGRRSSWFVASMGRERRRRLPSWHTCSSRRVKVWCWGRATRFERRPLSNSPSGPSDWVWRS